MVTVEEAANRLLGAKSFMSLGACSGCWQLPAADESSKLLTFNTPWSQYRFAKLPFGISSAPEIYQRKMDELFEGVPVEIMDADQKLRRVLDKSREVGLKFNPKQVKLCAPEVSFVGHVLSAEGLKPDPDPT